MSMFSTKGKADQPRGAVSPRSQALVCLLLVGLLLYNPFLALMQPHTGLSLHRLPRNRATVGASELQHFSPVTNALAAGELGVKNIGEIVAVVAEKKYPLAIGNPPSPVTLRGFSSNLWFRPPPSA